MRRIDNQIDVISKTFLGLTVACARCHDHKFDPITTKDYYALAGFLHSSRHQQASSIRPSGSRPGSGGLNALKQAIVARPARGRGHSCRNRSEPSRVQPRPLEAVAGTPQSRIATSDRLRGLRPRQLRRLVRHGRCVRRTAQRRRRFSARASDGTDRLAGPGRARAGAQRPGLRTGCRRASVADLHDRAPVYPLAGRGAGVRGSTSWSTASRRSATRSMAV